MAEKIKPGDDVVLKGRVTRVDEDRGMVFVTVRVEGLDVPVTLRVEFVRKTG